MHHITSKTSFSPIIYFLIAASGFATLAWEVIWQVKSTLALGISAWGAAITLAVVMGGMSLGSFLMGHALRNQLRVQAVFLYGLMEISAGVAGLFLTRAFHGLETFDTWLYSAIPGSIAVLYFIGIVLVLGVPTLCMGATFPVFGLLSEQFKVSVAKLYGLNTLGAAGGALFVAFILMPLFGMTHTIWIIAAINIIGGILAWTILTGESVTVKALSIPQPTYHEVLSAKEMFFIVFVTGFATFTLEVAWFRSLALVFANTTDIFAIILACTLLALGLAAKNISQLKSEKKILSTQISIAGILILLFTPLLEHLDTIFVYLKHSSLHTPVPEGLNVYLNPDILSANWFVALAYIIPTSMKFFIIFFIIVPPVFFLGRAFPWIIENQRAFKMVGKLYAVNTLAAVMGSLTAAWLLLPALGFAKTAWIVGTVVVAAGIVISSSRKRIMWTLLGGMALAVAIYFQTGIGISRAQGYFATDNRGEAGQLLQFFEGPAATLAALQYQDGARSLLINSTYAAGESGPIYNPSVHYMAWMGHLPMLLHADPKLALVICFGTGQTANAVRHENPQALDIVDVNKHIFQLAHNFKSNEDVLHDPRVKTTVMDGRAYLRRTQKLYDVITLEPMPPNAAGVNALYSKEFYQLARKRLAAKGVIAQWLPFNTLAPHYSASIAKTFLAVFPNAILWLDRESNTGILLGSNEDSAALGAQWPGFARGKIKRDLSLEQIKQYVALDNTQLQRYANYGDIITDDNQLLAYGKALYIVGVLPENFVLLRRVNEKIAMPDEKPLSAPT